MFVHYKSIAVGSKRESLTVTTCTSTIIVDTEYMVTAVGGISINGGR